MLTSVPCFVVCLAVVASGSAPSGYSEGSSHSSGNYGGAYPSYGAPQASGHGGSSGSYGGGYPSGYVVSTDYTSRYHGPGATPVVLPDGTLANTPEVAAARSAHLAALLKAQALWYGGSGSSGSDHGDQGSYSGSYAGAHSGSYSGNPSGSYSGSPSGSYSGSYSGGHSSSLAGSYAGDAAKGGSYGGAWPSYNGPLATAVVLPSGYLADSSDVAAAKVAHLGAVAQAYAEAAKWPAAPEESGHKKW